MMVLLVMLCVCTAHGPALPRDSVCTFSDDHGNHLFAVYAQNKFTVRAEWPNIQVIDHFTLCSF